MGINYILKGTPEHSLAIGKMRKHLEVSGIPCGDAREIVKSIPTGMLDCTDDGEFIMTGTVRQMLKLSVTAYKVGVQNMVDLIHSVID